MPDNKIVLTTQDREELAPLLNITKVERALMPKEVLSKLELLAKEQEEDGFTEIENIINESISFVKSLEAKTLYANLKPSQLKDYLWWETNYRIFLAQRKSQRERRKCYKNKANKE